jgi:Fic family protein
MLTLKRFSDKLKAVPAATSWYLADLGEYRGRQQLFTKQSPQKLKVLKEHALIESAVSSNRIEGVEVSQARIHEVVLGKSRLKDRSEEEVRCYKNALKLIHEHNQELSISEELVLKLHRISRGEIWDAGKYKEKNVDIIEKLPGGMEKLRFKTVEASKTPLFMRELVRDWAGVTKEKSIHPLIALAVFNLDFLCVHPFRDGNGRVSRLLLLLQSYQLGLEVGRYVSLERLIEQNKDRYYETLEQSSHGWHEGKNDPWPYVNYILFIFKTAYKEFEGRLGEIPSPKGAKTDLVIQEVRNAPELFKISDLQKRCPEVGIDLIRLVLKRLRSAGEVRCLGKGAGAQWKRVKP